MGKCTSRHLFPYGGLVLALLLIHRSSVLKEHSQGILSYFEYRQNYRYIEGNLKIILNKDKKQLKR